MPKRQGEGKGDRPALPAGACGRAGAAARLAGSWLKLRKPLISAFIAFHLAAIWFWLLPKSTFRSAVMPAFNWYINAASLWQYWSVFAPVPKKYNLMNVAEIVYADGTTATWDFPIPWKMGYIERAFKERWRKWANESMWSAGNETLYPDAARFIARNNQKPGTRPVKVRLIRIWSWIEPPPAGIGKHVVDPFVRKEFFSYDVKAEDLE